MDYKDFYYKKDRLNQLRGFCLTVQNNSIMKAASIMHVEPATISKQIQSLERDLNISLFDRSYRKQRLTITEKGKEFYKVAVKAMQTVECAFNYFKNEGKEGEKREINFAIHHTVINYLIPNCIKEFRELYGEEVTFKIHNLKTKDAIQLLHEDKIDILIHFIEPPVEFESKELFSFDPIILMHKDNILVNKKDNEITFEDLSKQNMIMIDKDNIINHFVEICDTYNIKGNIEFINSDWELLENYIKLNLGIHLYSTLYNNYCYLNNSELISKNVKHLFPKIKINLTVKKGKIFTKPIENFVKIIYEEVKKYN